MEIHKVRRNRGFILFIVFLFVCFNLVAQTYHIGYLTSSSGSQKDEVKAGLEFLKKEGYTAEAVPLKDLSYRKIKGYDQLWYHRPDSTAFSSEDIKAGKAIKKYVSRGGKLLLTLDATRLVNKWNIEETPVTSEYSEVVDEGFGRKLGFHAFRKHPLFKGLHGGAYVFHPKRDMKVRKLGFYEDNLPKGPNASVLAIDWAYIFYHENNKLVWEYKLGEGNILAIGAYTYFAEPNFHEMQLQRFMQNVFDYQQGELSKEEALTWTYDQSIPEETKFYSGEALDLSEVNDETVNYQQEDLNLSRSIATDNYWDLPGRRLLLMGKEKAGFDELWAHPFMAFRDYKIGIKTGKNDIIWLDTMTPAIKFTPGVVVREYTINDQTLRETLSVSAEKEGMIIRYEWDGSEPVDLFVSTKSNLRLMWPYSSRAMGTMGYQWSNELNSLLVTDLKTRKMNAVIGFSRIPEQKLIGVFGSVEVSDGKMKSVETEKSQIAAGFLFELKGKNPLNVAITAGEEDLKEIVKVHKELLTDPQQLVKEAANQYTSLAENTLRIETPDPVFNEGYKWALAGTDQFLVETPGIGKSLVAGYGTTASGWRGGHEISGRPGYAWYFGRDAEWSGFALDAYGDFEKVREILKTFNRFQNVNGKIYHELSTSGSVHYDASDSTPLYVLLASHYLKASGDLEFIRETWKNIEEAVNYCYSTDTDGDGLIENTNVGHGWVEGGDLFGSHTTFYLAGAWAATLREAAYMANALGKTEQAKKYQADYEKIRQKVNKDYWNETEGFFNYGLNKDGSYNDEITILPAVPIYFNTLEDNKARLVTGRFANSNFTTDWGLRIRSEESKYFSPTGYHTGSVWPLFTGWVSLSEYETGRYTQGFTHFMNNLKVYKDWDLGSIEEVLNGSKYQPSGVCRHQGWSHTMVLQPIIEGMLGIKPDALNDQLSLSPRLPWSWEYLNVENIRVGRNAVDFDFKREKDHSVYNFRNHGEGKMKVDFNPLFPDGTEITEVFVNGQKIDFKTNDLGEGISLQLTNLEIGDPMEIKVYHNLGTGVLPWIPEAKPGNSSEGLRIIKNELNGNKYSLIVEGKPGKTYDLEVFSGSKIRSVKGADLLDSSENIHKMRVTIPDSDKNYRTKTIELEIN